MMCLSDVSLAQRSCGLHSFRQQFSVTIKSNTKKALSCRSPATCHPSNFPSGGCHIVDMREKVWESDVGWSDDAVSCKCPKGFHPCDVNAVASDLTWQSKLKDPNGYCTKINRTPPVVRGFDRLASSLCGATPDAVLTWESKPLPKYSHLDFRQMDGTILPSGETMCKTDATFVFCPGKP